MDETNKEILRLLRRDGRMSFTDIGKELGISRVAVQKRVKKLEEEGIIKGYMAVLYRKENVKMLMEITTFDADYEDLLEYLNRTGYVTELYLMTGTNRIHATAVAPDVSELKYLTKMVRKTFDGMIKKIECHAVKEIVKDTFGGVDYDRTERERSKRDG
ncbi:MAG: Lrp/AsnC family transcriptional regulator [Eubacterium sp.]|nr:Lrp/AsnC family transcriptional regulator [Eubacterium sp.]